MNDVDSEDDDRWNGWSRCDWRRCRPATHRLRNEAAIFPKSASSKSDDDDVGDQRRSSDDDDGDGDGGDDDGRNWLC